MGVGKIVADVGGGIVTKKVVDKVLDNEGENASMGKTVASVGAGVVAAKVIDDALDKREEQKKEGKESKEGGSNTVATVGAAVAAGAAVKAAYDTNEMKKMMQQDMQAKGAAQRENPFAKDRTPLQQSAQKELQNSSFASAVQQQQGNLQQTVDGKGMNLGSPAMDSEFSI